MSTSLEYCCYTTFGKNCGFGNGTILADLLHPNAVKYTSNLRIRRMVLFGIAARGWIHTSYVKPDYMVTQ